MRWRDAIQDPPTQDGFYFVISRTGRHVYGFRKVTDHKFDDHEHGRSGWGLGEQPIRWIDEQDDSENERNR